MAGEHRQPSPYQFLTSPYGAREPGTGDDPGAFGADVVAALRYLAEVINEGLQFGPVWRLTGLRRGALRTGFDHPARSR
jgi:hypothetical protein